ncbi:MAG: hypothetical protein WHU94_03445 [Thermogemmata sp.]|uniref:Uncharacterized protein n=1 Tax=Thermogemmata fonticola TaxID=2755323 RepID=A0A7V8VFJ8_9BACT|nr:hypothetical protein [Thermogemmata fonticola]MBA2227099.1 hypothetical protein [Thermogemmata fonticola]MCX8138998.1 hypothetical protein [Gemmataceae bacterium]
MMSVWRWHLLLMLAIIWLGAGCTHVRPVGPFAARWSIPSSQASSPPSPVTVPAPRPTPPMNLVAADDVLPDNPYAAVAKLKSELEADRRHLPDPPRTAEISRIRGPLR